jgi:hypothetical protein
MVSARMLEATNFHPRKLRSDSNIRLRTTCPLGSIFAGTLRSRRAPARALFSCEGAADAGGRLLQSVEMKRVFLFLTISFLQINRLWSHGIGGHLYQAEEGEDLLEAREEPARSSVSSSATSTQEKKERGWAAILSTGWTSREVQYGVDQTGDYGAYTTELALRFQNLTLSGWFGIGTGNHYQEWDLTVSYTFELGSVFITPGYNFSYQRSVVEDQALGTDQRASARRNHREAREDDPVAPGQSSETYGNEIFFFLGTSVFPNVTPGILFVSDVVNPPGSYLEIRLDGEIPVYREVFELQPYLLLSINLGYNTTDYYGWNNFQFGFLASWKINGFVSIVGGINYSVALTALQQIGQDNEVWASGGVMFSY